MVIVGMFIENTMGRMYANFQYCVSTFKPFPASVTNLDQPRTFFTPTTIWIE